MTRRAKAVALLALLAACTVPGVARADTDVVLSNESRDTEVHTGESHVVNNNNSTSSSTVDPQESVTEQQGTSAPAVQGTAQAVAPASAGSAPSGQAAAPAQVTPTVEALFVGLPTSSTTVTP